MNTVRGIDLLKRYETVLADRMTALRGIAEAFRNGTLGPLTDEQKVAMDMLERSAEKLWRDLHEFKHALSGGGGLEEVSTFVNAALEPLLEQMRARSIVLETALPPIPIRVRTGGWAGTEAIRILTGWVMAAIPAGARLRVAALLSGDLVVVEIGGPHGMVRKRSWRDELDLRLGEAKRLLSSLGGNLWLERDSSGCSIRLTLPAAHH
jgi:hypothetical protein